MHEVTTALGQALRGVWQPRMLVLTLLPTLAALALWAGLAWLYWDNWAQWLNTLITGSYASQWLAQRTLDTLAHYSALLSLFLVLAPLIFVTAVLVASMVEMPVIVGFVANRDYPELARRHGGTMTGSIANALTTVLIFAGLWIVTLPLWLTGVLVPVLMVALSAYLNQRLFRYDALSEHAGAEEFRAIVAASGYRMYLLGALLGVFYFVPLLNFLAPVLSGLAFTHFCLARLAELRQAKQVK